MEPPQGHGRTFIGLEIEPVPHRDKLAEIVGNAAFHGAAGLNKEGRL